jgi:hypothetical protein
VDELLHRSPLLRWCAADAAGPEGEDGGLARDEEVAVPIGPGCEEARRVVEHDAGDRPEHRRLEQVGRLLGAAQHAEQLE